MKSFFLTLGGRTYSEAQLVGAPRCAEEIYAAYAIASEELGGDDSRCIEWDAIDEAYRLGVQALPDAQRLRFDGTARSLNESPYSPAAFERHHQSVHLDAMDVAARCCHDDAAHASAMETARFARLALRHAREESRAPARRPLCSMQTGAQP